MSIKSKLKNIKIIRKIYYGLKQKREAPKTLQFSIWKRILSVLFFKAGRTKCPVGRKKAPSWKKICFQLEKFFSLTGNPVLGGY